MSRSARCARILLVCLSLTAHPHAQAPPGGTLEGSPLETALHAVVHGTRSTVVDAAGLTGSGRRLWSVEPSGDNASSLPKIVVIGGLDGNPESTDSVMELLRWWFTAEDTAVLRGQWQLAAIPCARPDFCEATGASPGPLAFPPAGGFFDGKLDPTPHYIWRWTTMQAPTVVVDVRVGSPLTWYANPLAIALVDDAREAPGGTLAAALGAGGAGAAWSAPVPALQLSARKSALPEAVGELARRAVGAISPLRIALNGRASRAPLDIARLLAPRYPAQPVMSYIPALAWSGALRLAELTGETRFRIKPLADMAPFQSGQTPPIAEPYLLASLAGHLAFADLAAIDGNSDADALARKGADFILPETAGEIVRFPRHWTDDMFMATSVLARVAARTKDERYASAAGRLLTAYAADLQRPDGLFVHAKEGPHAWGRGNGFAAFGLTDALTYLGRDWPERERVLQSYRALMKALVARQAPDGMWRQVVDEPGSYREFTATAMVITAMARGVRLAWVDAAEFRPVVDRAWRGLLARIAEDGSLMDVCTGTGSGPTKEYYLNRAGLTGADDRGGAMALTAAIEMELVRSGRAR
jgi:unsaturated rhamnogalacturonyl hydrolase